MLRATGPAVAMGQWHPQAEAGYAAEEQGWRQPTLPSPLPGSRVDLGDLGGEYMAWDGGVIGGAPLSPLDFADDDYVDTAQIRALREHASALQRHLSSSADRSAAEEGAAAANAYASMGSAGAAGASSGFRADDSWASLYRLEAHE